MIRFVLRKAVRDPHTLHTNKQVSTRVFHVLESQEMVYLPVLCNVKSPLEFQVPFLVVIDEGADCGVVATSEHSGWSIFFGDCFT